MRLLIFPFNRCVAAVVATSLVCGGIALSALAQTTNTSTHTKSSTAGKGGRVNVNTADVKALESLPGISTTLANRIVAGRPYQSADDLKKVKGLTQTKIDGLKNKISFSGTSGSARTSHSKKKSSVASTEGATNATRTAKSSSEEEESSAPLAATGAATGHSSGTSGTPKKTGPSEPININTASLEQLEQLPGVGPTHAQAIIDYREQNGKFGSIEDIEKVKGIKGGEFSKIKDMIKVSE